MKEKKNQKLVVNKKTVANLESDVLKDVRGGVLTQCCITDNKSCWQETDGSWQPGIC